MPTRKKIGLTGPSAFTPECMEAAEKVLETNFVLLYQSNDENVKDWLDEVHGVVLAGGVDIHPTIYGESIWNNHNLSKFDIKRDYRELAIIEYCLKTGKPLLGICRGHQLIGCRFNMGFLMDLASSTICHQPKSQGINTTKEEPMHSVKLLDTELFYQTYPMPQSPPERKLLESLHMEKKHEPRLWVNSFHHQALAYNPKRDYGKDGIVIMGTAVVGIKDVCKDIIEFMQGNNWLSVQWHPEYDWEQNSASRCILEKFKKMIHAN